MTEVRPLRADETHLLQPLASSAFADLDERLGRGRPAPWPEQRRRWYDARVAHLRAHDPDRQFLALDGEEIVGAALASMREGLWGLSLLVVRPGLQGGGLGRRLITAALGDHTGRGVICASADGRALRRYAAAGFDAYPTLLLQGTADVSSLHDDPAVRDDVDPSFADAVDRVVRGAAHGPDHPFLQQQPGFGLAYEAGPRRGYGYSSAEGYVSIIAGTDDGVAAALLTAMLVRHAEQGLTSAVSHVTGGQQWAVRVGVAAGLRMSVDGGVFWRGMPEPRAYLPSGTLL